jgi:pyridoxamine 5'-phosphate oxidase family protein
LEERPPPANWTESEADFLLGSKLGRLATVCEDGAPHVVPVHYEFDGKYLYFSGWDLERSRKFKNIIRNNSVAFVVDDLRSENPWRPRGLEIRGFAEVVLGQKHACVRITATHKVSWGLGRRQISRKECLG